MNGQTLPRCCGFVMVQQATTTTPAGTSLARFVCQDCSSVEARSVSATPEEIVHRAAMKRFAAEPDTSSLARLRRALEAEEPARC